MISLNPEGSGLISSWRSELGGSGKGASSNINIYSLRTRLLLAKAGAIQVMMVSFTTLHRDCEVDGIQVGYMLGVG